MGMEAGSCVFKMGTLGMTTRNPFVGRPCPVPSHTHTHTKVHISIHTHAPHDQAALLTPSATLCEGGDVSKSASMMPPLETSASAPGAKGAVPAGCHEEIGSVGAVAAAAAADGWPRAPPGSGYHGAALLERSGAVARAWMAPLLPGALLHPALQVWGKGCWLARLHCFALRSSPW
jgi:hypothetical protein